MIRKRILAPLAIASAAIGVAGTSVLPVASADTLGNGVTVNCTQDTDTHATCIVTGCPRVGDDYVPQTIHYMLNGGGQVEEDYSCGGGYRIGVDNKGAPINLGVQLTRKHFPDKDDNTAYANYTFNPPAKPAAPAAPAPAAPPAAAPVPCPDGSTVPAGQTCPVKKVAPTNAVTMNVQKAGLQVNVTVGNTSDLAAQCTYDATEANGLGSPVHRDFSLAAKGSTTLNFPAPLLGQSWQLVSACNANFEGQTVEIGRKTGTA